MSFSNIFYKPIAKQYMTVPFGAFVPVKPTMALMTIDVVVAELMPQKTMLAPRFVAVTAVA